MVPWNVILPNRTEIRKFLSHSKKKRKGLSAILHHCLSNEGEDELSYEEKVDKEIKRYEEYPPVDMDTDPLIWWKDEQKKFPALGFLARKYLCLWHKRAFREAFQSRGKYCK